VRRDAVTEEPFEGWYTDPYGRHEARWMSDGKPTRLVRDGRLTSVDEPEGPALHTPEPIEHPEASSGDDLLRADADQAEVFDQEKATRAVFDVWDIYGPRQ